MNRNHSIMYAPQSDLSSGTAMPAGEDFLTKVLKSFAPALLDDPKVITELRAFLYSKSSYPNGQFSTALFRERVLSIISQVDLSFEKWQTETLLMALRGVQHVDFCWETGSPQEREDLVQANKAKFAQWLNDRLQG